MLFTQIPPMSTSYLPTTRCSKPMLVLLVQYNTINYRIYSDFPGFSTNVLFRFQDLTVPLVVMSLSLLWAVTGPQSLLVFPDIDAFDGKVYLLCKKSLHLGLSSVFS